MPSSPSLKPGDTNYPPNEQSPSQLWEGPKTTIEYTLEESDQVEKFIGQLSENGSPASGQLCLRDGNFYVGEVRGLTMEGAGQLHFTSTGSWYRGTFSKGLPVQTENGKLFSIDPKTKEQTTFVGKVDKDFRKLSGELKYPDVIYFGKFKNDKLCDDNGVLTLRTGEVIEGRFVAGKAERGKVTYGHGCEYFGELKNNKPHGKGVFKTPSYSYEGEFNLGLYQGACLIKFNSKTVDPELVESIEGFIDHLTLRKEPARIWLVKGSLFEGEFDDLQLEEEEPSRYESYSLVQPALFVQPTSCALNGRGKIENQDRSVLQCEFRSGKGEGKVKIVKEKEFTLTGELKCGKKHGEFSITYTNGSILQCLYINGTPIKGTFTTKEGDIYNGPFNSQQQFHTNPEHPVGTLCYCNHPSIRSYEGEFEAGRIHGRGKIIKKNGDEFEGLFQKGSQLGEGVLRENKITSSGDIYKGYFQKLLLDGNGCKLEMKSLNYYSGRFSKGQFQEGDIFIGGVDPATQELTYPFKGTKFSGEFVGGVINGTGTAKYPDGSLYIGELLNRLRHGIGELQLADGAKVHSKWERDLLTAMPAPHMAKYTYPASCKEYEWFSGPIKSLKGRPTGTGTVKFRDGATCYVGEVQEGAPHGWGKLYLEHSDLIYEGEFRQGLKHGKGKIVYKDGKREKGLFERGEKK